MALKNTALKLELDAPNVGELEKKYLGEAIDNGFVSTFGPYVRAFEEKFASYLGVEKCASVQNGTAALHMALHELGITKGDEVIVPVLTFVATANPITYVGAKPVFADVDKNTWNIDPASIEKNITKKTKAIIPVHLYGNPCDMEKIMAIAKKHHLYVIEDATESIGAKYKGRYTGTFGDFGCFSFNGNKIITTGGGGMVAGKSIKKIEHIHFLVNQARDEAKGYYHPEIGFNYRMTNIQAALGMAQLQRLDDFLAKKSHFRDIYREKLKDIGCITFQKEYEGSSSSLWFNCILIDKKINIGLLQKRLKDKGLPTRRVFMPVSEFPPYKNTSKGSFKNARYIYEHALCLPSSTLNSYEGIGYACNAIKEIL